MLRRPPRSTRTDTLFPYTTLVRSVPASAVSGTAPIRLAPGQQLVFRAEKASAPVKVTSSPVSDRQWPEGVREYDGVPLADLVTEANRYATGPMLVASADIRDTRVSGTFRITDSKRLAENLANLLGLTVTGPRDKLLLSRRCGPASKGNWGDRKSTRQKLRQ